MHAWHHILCILLIHRCRYHFLLLEVYYIIFTCYKPSILHNWLYEYCKFKLRVKVMKAAAINFLSKLSETAFTYLSRWYSHDVLVMILDWNKYFVVLSIQRLDIQMIYCVLRSWVNVSSKPLQNWWGNDYSIFDIDPNRYVY